MVATAMIGSAVVGAAGSAYAADQAADAQADAAREAGDTEREMFYQTRADYAPYREIGASALARLGELYGISSPTSDINSLLPEERAAYATWQSQRPEMATYEDGFGRVSSRYQDDLNAWEQSRPAFVTYGQDGQIAFVPSDAGSQSQNYEGFYQSPDYQFAYNQGMRSTEQSLAKRGLTGSGAEMKALTRFGQGLASQQLGNYKNSLAALAGIGQTSTSQLGALGANTASSIAQGQLGAGQARASSYLNQGAALSGAVNDISQYYAMQQGGLFGSTNTAGRRGGRV